VVLEDIAALEAAAEANGVMPQPAAQVDSVVENGLTEDAARDAAMKDDVHVDDAPEGPTNVSPEDPEPSTGEPEPRLAADPREYE
jgi:hypothetical protein